MSVLLVTLVFISYTCFTIGQTFLEFRCSIIERRANFQLKRAEDRDHIVEVSPFSLLCCKSTG